MFRTVQTSLTKSKAGKRRACSNFLEQSGASRASPALLSVHAAMPALMRTMMPSEHKHAFAMAGAMRSFGSLSCPGVRSKLEAAYCKQTKRYHFFCIDRSSIMPKWSQDTLSLPLKGFPNHWQVCLHQCSLEQSLEAMSAWHRTSLTYHVPPPCLASTILHSCRAAMAMPAREQDIGVQTSRQTKNPLHTIWDHCNTLRYIMVWCMDVCMHACMHVRTYVRTYVWLSITCMCI